MIHLEIINEGSVSFIVSGRITSKSGVDSVIFGVVFTTFFLFILLLCLFVKTYYSGFMFIWVSLSIFPSM